jgi:two-component system alkaline phosphatase synthesis response regulator PhoP
MDMPKQVMVVDDEIGALALIAIILERNGYGVVKAQGGPVALDLLEKTQPDLFVLDLMMPEMDGIELCKRIRTMPGTASTPIILLSARSDPETVERAMRAGANDYLSKPVFQHALVNRVAAALGLDEPAC